MIPTDGITGEGACRSGPGGFQSALPAPIRLVACRPARPAATGQGKGRPRCLPVSPFSLAEETSTVRPVGSGGQIPGRPPRTTHRQGPQTAERSLLRFFIGFIGDTGVGRRWLEPSETGAYPPSRRRHPRLHPPALGRPFTGDGAKAMRRLPLHGNGGIRARCPDGSDVCELQR